MEEEKNKEKMVSLSGEALLDFVFNKFKGVPLFPEKLQQAKDFIEKVKVKKF
jgi:hypothetical protein